MFKKEFVLTLTEVTSEDEERLVAGLAACFSISKLSNDLEEREEESEEELNSVSKILKFGSMR